MRKHEMIDMPKLKLCEYWNKYGKTILDFGEIPTGNFSSGIGSNTFRIFHKKDNDKSKMNLSKEFTKWAISASQLLKRKDTYSELHNYLIDNLDRYAENNILFNLDCKGKKNFKSIYARRKIVDLFVKEQVFRKSQNMDYCDRKWLVENAYQPLDNKSLSALRDIFEKKDEAGTLISKNASMGYINTEERYYHFQKEIKNICEQYNVPLFAFDWYCWNYFYSNN